MGKATEGPVRQGTWKWSHVTEEQWCFTGFLQAAFGQVRFACVSQTTTTKLSCSGEERTVSAQCRSTTRIWNLWAKITEPSRHHTAGSFRNARLTAHKAQGCLMHLLPPQEPACTDSHDLGENALQTRAWAQGCSDELTYLVKWVPRKRQKRKELGCLAYLGASVESVPTHSVSETSLLQQTFHSTRKKKCVVNDGYLTSLLAMLNMPKSQHPAPYHRSWAVC